MFLTYVKNVLDSLWGVTITGIGFNFISNIEVMSVVSNGCMGGEAMNHLGGEE